MENGDAILEALDKIKDWAMDHILKSGDEPQDGEASEPAIDEESEPELEMDSEEPMPEEDEAPKSTVLKRYDFAGRAPVKPGAEELPFKKRRR